MRTQGQDPPPPLHDFARISETPPPPRPACVLNVCPLVVLNLIESAEIEFTNAAQWEESFSKHLWFAIVIIFGRNGQDKLQVAGIAL